jgi:hypothetical protein
MDKRIIDAVIYEAELVDYTDGGEYPELLNPEPVAQAVIDAFKQTIWHKYAPMDKASWPKTHFAPSGQMWITEVQDPEDYLPFINRDTWSGDDWDRSPNVIRYLDPADIMIEVK